MKKFLALILALVMVFALVACGEKATPDAGDKGDDKAPEQTVTTEIPDEMTSEDGKYEVAFVTDVGALKDKSFNQGTYDGVKEYASKNNLSYKYYQPANGDQATDDDRYDAMKAAVEGGAKVVVCAGFMQAGALEKAAKEFTDVNFVFIDGWPLGLDNVAAIAFKEQECGFFAGYAVVKEGYTKLGFCGGGGGTNDACCRYGWGFVQGANAAAAEMGKNVEVKYTWQYGGSFQPSAELQTLASGWYENGTEVIFSCGGSIFDSITAAASANDGLVVGVDSDQSYDAPGIVITSALKGVGAAASWAIAKSYDGTWSEIANTGISLGAADGATGLPTDTWSMKNYTVAEYEAQLAAVIAGTVTIDDSALKNGEVADQNLSNTTVEYVG
ncbi:MAG: BMP family ABC transporter substrate-binding protein [Oscillospiraceae bacterium]|nr:BMP family ABC transporter substrate-binding protein [Oscillospiraceae bacterium]